MKRTVLDIMKHINEPTNPTHIYIVGKTLGWLADEVTYEEVDFAVIRLSVEGQIKKIDNVNYEVK